MSDPINHIIDAIRDVELAKRRLKDIEAEPGMDPYRYEQLRSEINSRLHSAIGSLRDYERRTHR